MPALKTEGAPTTHTKKRRWPLYLAFAAAAILVVLIALDITARVLAQNQLASQVRSSTGARSTTARIDAFPFLPPLLTGGSIARIDVTADQVPAGLVVLDRVTVHTHEIRLDRHTLLSHRQIAVKAIASARITVEITTASISSAIGYPVTLSANKELTTEINGTAVRADVKIEDGDTIVVTAAGVRLGSVDLTSSGLVPKCDMAREASTQTIVFSCDIAPVPASLLQSLSDFTRTG